MTGRVTPMRYAALALVAGCTVGPDYHRPPADVRPTFAAVADPTRSAVGGSAASVGAATSRPSTVQAGVEPPDRWWTTLGDPTLDALVDRAVRSNLGLRVAAARIRQSRAAAAGTEAGLFPLARTAATYNYNHNGGPLFPIDTQDYQFGGFGFDASWEVDVFGGLRRSVEAAADEQQASVEARRDAVVSLLAEVCREYVVLRTAQRRAAIARDDVRIAQELLDLAKRQAAVGISGDLDVDRAEGQVTATASALPPLDAQAQQAIHGLGVLLGEPPDTLLAELSVAAPIPGPPARVPVGLPGDLLRRRPDVRRSERRLAAATASIGVAVAQLYPRFSLNGDLGIAAPNTGGLTNWHNRFFTVGPGAAWRLFDAGRVLSEVDARRAVREEVLAEYEQSILSAARDVEDAIVAFDRTQDARELTRRTVRSTGEAVRIAREQYAEGVTGFLTVLDAERSLFAAQDQLAQSDGAIDVELVALFKGLGGGWQATERLAPAEPDFPKPPMPAAQLVTR